MPKIIENLESKLMEAAKQQIEQSGYGAMTIRSVPKACGVGVGTVYNYFPSKDSLLAASLLEDWSRYIAAIEAVSTGSDTPNATVRCIHDQLRQFVRRHQTLFRDQAAAASYAGAFSRYHALLRGQLADPLRKFCGNDFAPEFIAEALLTWTLAEKEFDEIYGMVERLF